MQSNSGHVAGNGALKPGGWCLYTPLRAIKTPNSLNSFSVEGTHTHKQKETMETKAEIQPTPLLVLPRRRLPTVIPKH